MGQSYSQDGAMALDFETVHAHACIADELRRHYATATTMREQWEAIRAVYRYYLPRILDASQRWNRVIDPYFVDWTFTPIEEMAWMIIRSRGIPFYPQFPIGPFFIDFANPYHRIGIELDGEAYHTTDKDQERDERLLVHGWRIFHIPGRETSAVNYFLPIELESEQLSQEEWDIHMRRWLCETCDGVLAAIAGFFFHPDQHIIRFGDLALRSLSEHYLLDGDWLPSSALRNHPKRRLHTDERTL